MTFAVFHDFPGLENGLSKFQDFPGLVITLRPGIALTKILIVEFSKLITIN